MLARVLDLATQSSLNTKLKVLVTPESVPTFAELVAFTLKA
jgi:hypothetical protein